MGGADPYVRQPAVVGDVLLLVTDGDLWIADAGGGRAHRLTDGRTPASHPVCAPDGSAVAFTGRDSQHPEAFAMPLEGGAAERMTYLGADVTTTRTWDAELGLVVATSHGLPFVRDSQLLAVGPTPGHHRPLGWGSAHELATGPGGRVLIGRHTTNQGRWKRYRGGTAGQLWLDRDGTGRFTRLLPGLRGDIGSPMLIGDRAWFISDHTGVGNVCSCDLDGADLQVHTAHDAFYARTASTDGRTIVYASGGDVWRLDPADPRPERIDLRVGAPRVQRTTTYVDAARWVQGYAVSPRGTHVALRVRGRAFAMALHDGPVVQHGARQGANHRLVRWSAEGDALVLIGDASGEERIEVHGPEGLRRRVGVDLGVPLDLAVCPDGRRVAVTDQQGRLRVLDLEADGADGVVEVAASPCGVDDPTWSPDGRWLAWSERETSWHTARIRLWRAGEDGGDPVVLDVTDGRAAHRAPSFDPSGRHLYWIAGTRFTPVRDGIYTDHGFPHPDVVMAAVLRAGDPHPMHREPRAPGTPAPGTPGGGDRTGGAAERGVPTDGGSDTPSSDAQSATVAPPPPPSPPPVEVDADGLTDRVVPLPFPTGRYRAVVGLHGKVMALAVPLRPPPPPGSPTPTEPRPAGALEVLDLDTGAHEVVVPGVSSVAVSADRRTVVYGARRRLRAIKAGVKPPEAKDDAPRRTTGWIDLSRISVRVDPPAEWRQIFDEAWRLQRDLFWHSDMSGVDWPAARARYGALIDRIASRAELSDLIWEMFGELGTGHAYERGGDHPSAPQMPVGHLGVDLELDPGGGTADPVWRIARVLQADPTDPDHRRPLRGPGATVRDGAAVLAVDGTPVDADTAPAALLVDRADRDVVVRVADPAARDVVVRPLRSEQGLRYADWVLRAAGRVAARSDGRVGYVHIPDMGARGYAAFHRQYLAAVHAEALVVDVRFNGGGNVSSLLLEKLAGRRIGYQMRRTGALEPYPHHAPRGPLVAIANERCGSDGDIFTHAWKRLGLGPVVGTRTWGGVIGIQPRHSSADGTVTTQPGFAFWFDDVGWGVENHGTDPTHPVEIAPHDAAAGVDPQLDTAVDLAVAALEAAPPPPLPDIATAPHLGHPGDPLDPDDPLGAEVVMGSELSGSGGLDP